MKRKKVIASLGLALCLVLSACGSEGKDSSESSKKTSSDTPVSSAESTSDTSTGSKKESTVESDTESTVESTVESAVESTVESGTESDTESDVSGNGGTSDTEDGIPADEEALIRKFIAGTATCDLSDKYIYGTMTMPDAGYEKGAAYTAENLINGVMAGLGTEITQNLPLDMPEISFAKLDGNKYPAYAVKFVYFSEYDNYTQIFVLSIRDGRLVLDFAVGGSYRSWATVYKSGVCVNDGSAGANCHITDIFTSDSENAYHKIYSEIITYGDGSFSPSDLKDANKFNKAISEYYDYSGDANVVFYAVQMDDKVYVGHSPLDTASKEKLDRIAADAGVKFNEDSEIDAAVASTYESLGVLDKYENSVTDADWIRF